MKGTYIYTFTFEQDQLGRGRADDLRVIADCFDDALDEVNKYDPRAEVVSCTRVTNTDTDFVPFEAERLQPCLRGNDECRAGCCMEQPSDARRMFDRARERVERIAKHPFMAVEYPTPRAWFDISARLEEMAKGLQIGLARADAGVVCESCHMKDAALIDLANRLADAEQLLRDTLAQHDEVRAFLTRGS